MDIDRIKKWYYEDGLSCRDIGEKIDKTVWQIYRLMKRKNLTLRRASETLQIQFYKKPLSFRKKKQLSYKEKLLHQSGLMLYWAEGTKTDDCTVDFANSNEKMVLIYIKMLREIYRVDKKRIRILLYCYANQDHHKLIDYWSIKLQVPKAQFIKPYIRHDYNKNKTHKMPHGLIHIRYNDKRLFMKIMEEIDIIASKLLQS
ncbi:hypothetical protein COV53_02910 [Candidatus Gottesmanbacteria bacterium CG11_big_fil_rev_8_21_14_0_20_37_11]|uniref:Uncharacterized protein n=1 Tax=Candidatus Gottesmanbacteria bacterium CG11_big_fil_rev_8_21_14_0_20_37_11 TaxID=1974575 RepID=A0A2H0NHU5_9BACT|nr:MAG: hypothetical protein COV53_02910 [Candidatus Gottesmanbacteria bacterium CG11_big_fil_rev_8_21_14_0_20_37_11]